jgi:hypothetical protein
MEKHIEKKLKDRIEKIGGKCCKWVSPGYRGVQDRILFFPGGIMALAELKAPGEKQTPLQRKRQREFEALGFKVFVIDHESKIQEVVDEIQTDSVRFLQKGI